MTSDVLLIAEGGADQKVFELLRVWVANRGKHVSLRSGVWNDPGASGRGTASLVHDRNTVDARPTCNRGIPVPLRLPPLDAFVPTERRPRDRITLAVLSYLAAMRAPITTGKDLEGQAKALGDVIGICYSACQHYQRKNGGQGLFLWNEWPGYVVTGKNGRRENTRHDQLREWIQMWLLNELAPYHGEEKDAIGQASDEGKFCNLRTLCWQSLIKEIRRHYPEDGLFPRVSVSLDSHNDGDTDHDPLSECVTGPALNLNFKFDPGDPQTVVDANRGDVDRLGIREVLEEFARGSNNDLAKGEITRKVAARFGVCERQARNKKVDCRSVLTANLNNPVYRRLFGNVSDSGDDGELKTERSTNRAWSLGVERTDENN
jgi:hypothetical protein